MLPLTPGPTSVGPGAGNSLASNLHKSYMPVVASGDVASGGTVTLRGIDSDDVQSGWFL